MKTNTNTAVIVVVLCILTSFIVRSATPEPAPEKLHVYVSLSDGLPAEPAPEAPASPDAYVAYSDCTPAPEVEEDAVSVIETEVAHTVNEKMLKDNISYQREYLRDLSASIINSDATDKASLLKPLYSLHLRVAELAGDFQETVVRINNELTELVRDGVLTESDIIEISPIDFDYANI